MEPQTRAGTEVGKLCGLFKIKLKNTDLGPFCSIHRKGGWYGWVLGFLDHSGKDRTWDTQLYGPSWTEDGRCFPKDIIY